MYEQITSYLGKLKPPQWKAPKNQGDGSHENPFIAGWPDYDEITSEFMEKMYDFVPNGGQHYDDVILKATGINCREYISDIDVSNIDGDIILYIIFSMVRGERFSDGLFGSYIKDGLINKMLLRLKEIDENLK